MKYLLIPLAIAVLVLVGKNNPYLFSSRPLWIDDGRRGEPVPIFQSRDRRPDTTATFIYRGGAERTGVTDEAIDLNLTKKWESHDINSGTHTASKSSPAVDASGIYVGQDIDTFYAFDFSGESKWHLKISGTDQGFHATAALDQHRVYIGGYNGKFYCLDKRSGELQWVTRLGDGIGSSALLDDHMLYISVETKNRPNGYIVKLKADDGSFVWKTELLGDQPHSSVALDREAGLAFAGANSAKFFAIDMRTGQIRWSKEMAGPIKSTAAVHDHVVYVTDRGGWTTAFQTTTGNIVWRTRISEEPLPHEGSQTSPALVPSEDLMIIGARDGMYGALKMSTGEILWSHKSNIVGLRTSATITKSRDAKAPWIAWMSCEMNELCALNPKSGKILAKFNVSGPITGIPVFYDGSVYVSTDAQQDTHVPGHLVRFGP